MTDLPNFKGIDEVLVYLKTRYPHIDDFQIELYNALSFTLYDGGMYNSISIHPDRGLFLFQAWSDITSDEEHILTVEELDTNLLEN